MRERDAVQEDERRILHCDMDCFYAAVHMRDDPGLVGQPVLIGGDPGGRGVVAAASYEARRFGVRSAMPSARAARLCPQAVFIHPDFPRYRAESLEIFAIFRDLTPLVQAVSIDEAYLDVTPCLEAWRTATAIAREVRRRVLAERRLTVSVGVGPNKLIAKIASDHDKPDGLTVVPPQHVAGFLAPLSIRALPGVGPATHERMKRLDIETIEDLRSWREEALVERFGRYGARLYRFARGEDSRPVSTSRERKSVSSERTFSVDLSSLEEMEAELDRLAERVAGSLEKRDLVGRTVSIKVRYSDFTTVTRALTMRTPSADAETLRQSAVTMLRRTAAAERPVRLLGVGCSGLSAAGRGQMALFDGGSSASS